MNWLQCRMRSDRFIGGFARGFLSIQSSRWREQNMKIYHLIDLDDKWSDKCTKITLTKRQQREKNDNVTAPHAGGFVNDLLCRSLLLIYKLDARQRSTTKTAIKLFCELFPFRAKRWTTIRRASRGRRFFPSSRVLRSHNSWSYRSEPGKARQNLLTLSKSDVSAGTLIRQHN